MAKLNCVTVLAPAKLNLALDVVGLLPNGYHNLDKSTPSPPPISTNSTGKPS